ncbi:Uncharacterised protein [Segatella oris]|uniref:Uncharacterized protein n=1 Tax=Segatella oris TaxID=28135 RepID=A0A448L2Z2_9BACT|nr:Uncharacterised protein [Segatella oris]
MHNYNANAYLLPRKLALPPWEGQGEVTQVSTPLLGEGLGEVTQVSTPLLGRGWGRLRKLALPSLGGVGGGYAN